MDEYRLRTLKSVMECSDIEKAMKRKYSGQALKALLADLENTPNVETASKAFEQVRAACERVSEQFPLKWTIEMGKTVAEATTERHMLIAHVVWINSNGAYRIVTRERTHVGTDSSEDYIYQQGGETIFEKEGLELVAFAEPDGYGDGSLLERPRKPNSAVTQDT